MFWEPTSGCTQVEGSGVSREARGEFVRFGPDILASNEELAKAAGILADAGPRP